MSLETKMRASVQAYFDLFNAGEGDALAALFADNASLTDPVGTEPKTGKDDILSFYRMATQSGTTLEPQGPVRIAGDCAAFAFRVHIKGIKSEDKAIDVDLPAGAMTIDIIDIFRFNEDAKIIDMQAYWGPSNISQ